LWHSHVAPASGATDTGAAHADANNDRGRRRFQQRWQRQRTHLLRGPHDYLDDDAFIVPPRKERRVAVVDAHDSDDGDDDNDPAFFVALATPSTTTPLSYPPERNAACRRH